MDFGYRRNTNLKYLHKT